MGIFSLNNFILVVLEAESPVFRGFYELFNGNTGLVPHLVLSSGYDTSGVGVTSTELVS